MGPVSDGDLYLTLAGLRPGWYVARDIYPRFLAMEEVMGNHPPRTKIQFGMALSRTRPSLESRQTHGHAKAWLLTEEVLIKAAGVRAQTAEALGWKD